MRPEQERRGFEARSPATSVLFPDGCCRTIVWRHRHGGSITALELFAKALAAGAGHPDVVLTTGISGSVKGADRRREPDRWIGRILGPDEEAKVPCGRRHGGFWTPDGAWHEGEPGYILVSDERFRAQLQKIARSS